MFTFLFWMVIAIISVLGTYYGGKEIASRKTLAISARKTSALSWPARQIIREFHRLPKANRPYTNIYRVVAALDVKHGAENATSHFKNMYARGTAPTFAWSACRCGRRYCKYMDYQELHEGMLEIQSALEDQEQALRLAAVSGTLSEAKELAQRMRQERDLIETVTKELT